MKMNEYKKCYLGFTITCDKCNSESIFIENTMGWSGESGNFGSIELICNDCKNKIAIAGDFSGGLWNEKR